MFTLICTAIKSRIVGVMQTIGLLVKFPSLRVGPSNFQSSNFAGLFVCNFRATICVSRNQSARPFIVPQHATA